MRSGWSKKPAEGLDRAEVVVYDSGTEQTLGGGSIVIHTKKYHLASTSGGEDAQ